MSNWKTFIVLLIATLIVMLSIWASWYSFSRSQKISHNISCENSTILCAHEIIPPSLWEVITGKSCDGLLCGSSKSPGNLLSDCENLATTTPCSDLVAPNEDVPSFVQEFLGETGLKKAGAYTTSFETVEEFSRFYIVPQNHKSTASHSLASDLSVSGKSSHKAWIYGKNEQLKNTNTNHRAYPTIQMSKTSLGIVKTAVLVEISVWADIDLYRAEDKNWFSLATFTSYDDTEWSRSYLINVDTDYKVHLMHVPNQGESKPDIFSKAGVALPRRAWSKITTYIDYTRNNRFQSPIIAVWQDGGLVSASRFNNRVDPSSVRPELHPTCLKGWNGREVAQAEKMCGLKYEGGLAQMHFGLYVPPLLSRGVIYNDDLSVSKVVK